MNGEVVGVVSYILTKSGGFEGLGFVVPSNVAEKLLLSGSSFWTGIDGVLLTDDVARLFNLPQAAGVLVQRVASGSPAAALGLRAGNIPVMVQDRPMILGGDIVLEIGGIEVSDEPGVEDRMDQYLKGLSAGASITAKVLRGGEVLTLVASKWQ